MTHSFSSGATVAPNVLFRLVGDEAVLLNLKPRKLLTDTPSIPATHDVLLQEYDVEPARLRDDLDSFFGKLSEQGLIQVGHGEQ